MSARPQRASASVTCRKTLAATTLMVQFVICIAVNPPSRGSTSTGEYLVFGHLRGIGLSDFFAMASGNPRIQLVRSGSFSS